jgi:hypothetical protein
MWGARPKETMAAELREDPIQRAGLYEAEARATRENTARRKAKKAEACKEPGSPELPSGSRRAAAETSVRSRHDVHH